MVESKGVLKLLKPTSVKNVKQFSKDTKNKNQKAQLTQKMMQRVLGTDS